ncbi:MAG: TonB-dependent receptor, partial [Calditrichaeota bacterium]
MKYILFILMICACMFPAFAQDQQSFSVSGAVYGLHFHEADQDTVPLAAANIYWAGTAIGTTSDNEGHFQIPFAAEKNRLVIRYIGYENDTLVVNSSSFLTIYLKTLRTLDEVSVEADKPFTIHQQHAIVNTHSITQRGLQTLACCNLAESFENTTSVDVEQTDAVSGAKRIKMLGLAGFYSQILIEKNPLMRGLISPFGLEYIPGYWIDSIDISKGTSS